MTVTFENDNDIIIYALEMIISSARDNQYIILAHSVWWISSIIGLEQGLVFHIENVKIHSETIIATSQDIRDVSATPLDTQEESTSGVESQHIQPDRISQVPDTNNDLILDSSEQDHHIPVIKKTEQFIQKSRKETKAINKQKQIDSLSRMRSGRIIEKPSTKKQRNYLQTIPKHLISTYLINRDWDLRPDPPLST